MDILPACVSALNMGAMPVEARRGYQVPLEELWLVVNEDVGQETEIQSLCKSIKSILNY